MANSASLQDAPHTTSTSTGAPSWLESTRSFWIVLAITTAWRTLAAATLTLCFDETYYHYWSLHPQLSYFDHPPLTAWAMTLSNAVLGESVWSVRIWPLLGGTLVACVGRALGSELFGEKAGNRAGILLALGPAFIGNGLIMTPDALFGLAWALAVWFAWKALASPLAFSPWWLAAGLASGAGMLGKYNMVLFFLSLAACWLLMPRQRSRLFWGTLACGVVALLCFLPVLYWNWVCDWISFRFQLKHGLSAGRGALWSHVGNYLGALLILTSPLIGVLAFRSTWRALRKDDDAGRFAGIFFAVVVLFFGYSALKTQVQANWPLLGFFTAMLLVGRDWLSYAPMLRRCALGLLLSVDILAAGYALVPAQTPLMLAGRQLDPVRMNEFLLTKDIANTARTIQAERGADFIICGSHQMFGILAFYAPELRNRLWLPQARRPRFPWLKDTQWRGKTALLVSFESREAQRLKNFASVEALPAAVLTYKRNLKQNVFFALARDYTPE